MFVSSKPAHYRAAPLMPLTASGKANLVEPRDWLKRVLIQLSLDSTLLSTQPSIDAAGNLTCGLLSIPTARPLSFVLTDGGGTINGG